MNHLSDEATQEIQTLLPPENEVEAAILRQPEWQAGVVWGKPRNGHPEGKVLYHIQEILNNVEALSLPAFTRSQLRLITLTHDAFKYLEHRGIPRDWSQHHAVLARRFTERFTTDRAVLKVIEWHDEAYYAWKAAYCYHRPAKAQTRMDTLLQYLSDDLQLFYLFFKCDTLTGDKDPAPLYWFEQNVKGIDLVELIR